LESFLDPTKNGIVVLNPDWTIVNSWVYNINPISLTDWDRLELQLDETWRLKVDAELQVLDISIWAVELKDATSDDRVKVTNRGEIISGKVAYQTLIDESVTNISYIGKSLPWSLPSEAKRQIQKIDETVTPVTIKRADLWDFTNVRNNRAVLTYS
jgi:hypothetical protein